MSCRRGRGCETRTLFRRHFNDFIRHQRGGEWGLYSVNLSLVLVVDMGGVRGMSFSHGFRGEGITERSTD